MYNYTNFSNASNFDIRQPSQKLQNAGVQNGTLGGPLTDRPVMGTNGINKGFASETNVSVKATVRTRTRDQQYINQHQLAFIYTKKHDQPILLSIQQMNLLLAGGDPMHEISNRKLFGDNLHTWSKEKIQQHFKLFGAVVNRDVDTNVEYPKERFSRAFTVCIRGDCHILDYWSNNNNRLKKYDSCYLILKKIWISSTTSFQTSLAARHHNTGKTALNMPIEGRYCWQIVPFSTRDRSLMPEQYSSTIYLNRIKTKTKDKTKEVKPGTLNAFPKEIIGTYWRVGYTHEYASIGGPAMFSKRSELSVSRDISYLHDNGNVKPMQFYLYLDDDSKLI